MVEKTLLEQIYRDFVPLVEKKGVLGILLFGSYASDQQTNRSDIDICVVAPRTDNHELFSHILSNIDIRSKKYDVRMYSELPIHIQIRVIEKGILIYSPNKLDLYEYFYFYRKIWEDQKKRQELTKEELLAL